MRGDIFRGLLRRPMGLAALLVLLCLYACAVLAPFLAPYKASAQSLDHSFHPPTRLFWQEGRVHVQIYQNRDLSIADWKPLPGQSFALKFFARGEPYRLLGLIPMERHLFLPDSDDPRARV